MIKIVLIFSRNSIAAIKEKERKLERRLKNGFSGLIHFGARYYDPTIGRFISPNSVLGALSIPSSMNRYVAVNRP